MTVLLPPAVLDFARNLLLPYYLALYSGVRLEGPYAQL